MKPFYAISFIQKLLIVATSLCLFSACSNHQLALRIPAQQQIVIDYPNYDVFSAALSNRSLSSVSVRVVSKDESKTIRGFGLNSMGKATVMVEQENQLQIENTSSKAIRLNVDIQESNRSVFEKTGEYRKFTLHNTSGNNIQLIIPTVMNPNLLPFSKSGVDIKVGQEILFRINGKKHVLLTVDDSIKIGAVINVPKLIEKRKRELR